VLNWIGGGLKSAGSTVQSAVNTILSLGDVLELNLGFGLGIKAGFQYGVGRTGAGYVESERVGMDGRQVGTWSERNACFGLAPLSLVLAPAELFRRTSETCDSVADFFEMSSMGIERIERDNFSTTTILYHTARAAGPWHERPGDIGSLGGEFHLGFLGARLRLKPVQLVNTILSIFGAGFGDSLASPEYGGFARDNH
jgi:hypothetical protein